MKKNQENISKHGDACGIYTRICLRSCESKLSRHQHLLSALSQAIPPSFERKTYKNLIQNKKVIVIPYFVRVLLHNYSSKKLKLLVSPSPLGRDGRGSLYHLSKLCFALINPIPKSEDAERG